MNLHSNFEWILSCASNENRIKRVHCLKTGQKWEKLFWSKRISLLQFFLVTLVQPCFKQEKRDILQGKPAVSEGIGSVSCSLARITTAAEFVGNLVWKMWAHVIVTNSREGKSGMSSQIHCYEKCCIVSFENNQSTFTLI